MSTPPTPPGLPAWLVLGHRENLDVARTAARFSRDPRRWRDMQEGRVPADHPLTPMTAWQPVEQRPPHDRHGSLRSRARLRRDCP
ncbi:hypothetical protein [Streptomyces sp. SYSU K21746]